MNHLNGIFDSDLLRLEACRIIDTLISEYIVKKTFLCASLKNGKKSAEYTVKDLGDYVPFFLYFGYEDYCKQHLRDIVSLLTSDLLEPQSKLLRVPVSSTYDHSDFILGLVDYTEKLKDLDIEAQLEKTIGAVLRTYFYRSQPSSYYCPALKSTLPLFETKDGMYIELFVDLYRRYGNDEYLQQSERLFEKMIAIDYYRKLDLWPVLVTHPSFSGHLALVINRLRRQTATVRLMKNNTNTIFGFLSLYKLKKTEQIEFRIDSWVKAVEKMMISEQGLVYNFAKISGGEVIPYEPNLTVAFTVIDLFCDCSYFLNNPKYLHLAEKVAEFWLATQGRTGLFPLRHNEQSSYLDSETDMIVALMKLHELTGNPAYKDSARRAFSGLLKHHRTDSGYCLSVDKDSGEITDSTYKTKFIALMLKAFILFIENRGIYQDHNLYALLRDR